MTVSEINILQITDNVDSIVKNLYMCICESHVFPLYECASRASDIILRGIPKRENVNIRAHESDETRRIVKLLDYLRHTSMLYSYTSQSMSAKNIDESTARRLFQLDLRVRLKFLHY